MNKLDQIAALPLGGRVKLNPWDNKVELTKSAAMALTSVREKMPLEITPFFPRLTRLSTAAADASAAPTTTAAAAVPAAPVNAAPATTAPATQAPVAAAPADASVNK